MDPQSSVEEAIRMFQSSEPARGRDLFNEMVCVCPNNMDVWIQFLDQEIQLGDKRTIRALFHRATSLMLTPEKMMILFEKYHTYEMSLDKGRGKHVDVQMFKYVTSLFLTKIGRGASSKEGKRSMLIYEGDPNFGSCKNCVTL